MEENLNVEEKNKEIKTEITFDQRVLGLQKDLLIRINQEQLPASILVLILNNLINMAEKELVLK